MGHAVPDPGKRTTVLAAVSIPTPASLGRRDLNMTVLAVGI